MENLNWSSAKFSIKEIIYLLLQHCANNILYGILAFLVYTAKYPPPPEICQLSQNLKKYIQKITNLPIWQGRR